MTDLDLAHLDHRQRRLLERVLRRRGVDLSQLPVTPRLPEDEPVPLSDAQQRLWVVDRLEPGNPAYNEAYAVDFDAGRGPLPETGPLAAALAELVRRHEGLRTRFPAIDESPVQVVAPPAPVPLPRVDLAALPRRRGEAEAARVSAAEAARPFDLAHGPVLRAALLQGDGRHRLLLTLHHIVCDARSLGLVFSELEALYGAARRAAAGGEPGPLPPEPAVHYPDYALWQHRWLAGEVLTRLLDHWRGALDGYPTTLPVPTDRPRAEAAGGGSGRVDFRVDDALATAFTERARGAGATTFMAYLAAFAALLHRYTGRQRMVIGTAVENRRRPEVEGVVGFFVNTLAVPVDLTGRPGLDTLLERVRRAAVAAFDHQDLPFVRLVDAIQPERNALDRPLVQVFFVHQRAGQAGLAADGPAPGAADGGGERLPFLPRPLDTGAPKFDLTLSVDEGPGGVTGHLDYDGRLFDEVTARRMVANLKALLAAACAEPQRPLDEVPVLSPEARRRLLGEWRGGPGEGGDDEAPRVLEEIGRRAAGAPEAVAIVADDGDGGQRRLTFRQLTGRARRLAKELRHHGVGTDVPVGLVGGRAPETVVGALAILAAGGAYVPLDPELPAPRRDALLAGAGVEVTVMAAQPAAADGPPGTVVPVPAGGSADDGADDAGPWPPVPPPPPEALAYVIHTSGSTGTPKGVMVSHGALDQLTAAFRGALDLDARDRLLMVPAPSFDASVGNLFPVLAAGATLVLHPDPAALTAGDLGDLVDRRGVTVVDLPAAFWKGWVDALEGGEADPPRSLRLAISGGESLDPPRVAAWERHTGAALFGPYGPTETTVCATAFLTAPGWRRRVEGDRLPIGRPLPHARVAVVDDRGRPVPAGVEGELWLGGAAVARGYLGRAAETAARFRPDPWGPPGARAYHSGDLARWLSGGDLEFLGRRDRQVKIRGYRIEPGEVEAHLRRHPALRDAAVAAWGAGPARRLVAWVVGTDSAVPAPGELSAFLAASLPSHMVPGQFVHLDALPTTSRGKVDMDALAVPEDGGEASPTPPRNELEATLARIWGEVLERRDVGVEDDFFRLGGDSILALRIASRARREGLDLAPKDLFRQRTVARLATSVEAAREASETVAGPVPWTPFQRRFLDLHGGDPAAPAHRSPAVAWDLPASRTPSDPGAWRRALAVVVNRHDALRLAVEPDPAAPGGFRARVRPAAPERGLRGAPRQDGARLSTVDLTFLPASRRGVARRQAAAATQGSLHPVRGPLSRLLLLRAAGEPGVPPDDRLVWAAHHLAVDTPSWELLREELESAYHAAARGTPLDLPPPGTPFSTWARRLEGWAESAEPQMERDLWRRQTEGDPAPGDAAPPAADRPGRGTLTAGATAGVETQLSADTTRRLLETLPERFNATVEMALLTALAVAFQHHTDRPGLLVEMVGHGREALFPDLDLGRSVGCFTVAYPLFLAPPPDADRVTALLDVKERLRAVPHRGVGYGVLRWLTADAGGLAGRRRPQVALRYLGATGAGGGEAWAAPLGVTAALRDGRLRVDWTHGPSLRLPTTVEALARRTITALEELAAAVDHGGGRHHTPSDFPRAGLDRRGLDKLSALLERADASTDTATSAGDPE